MAWSRSDASDELQVAFNTTKASHHVPQDRKTRGRQRSFARHLQVSDLADEKEKFGLFWFAERPRQGGPSFSERYVCHSLVPICPSSTDYTCSV